MIKIQKSKTADTRSCDYSKVSKPQLLESSKPHIHDVKLGMDFLKGLMDEAAAQHDFDKITNIDQFHEDFLTGFKQTIWWDKHRKLNRHHLKEEDGVPDDVNLIDVLDMIVDCVMAGMGRSGEVYPLELPAKVLKAAFDNTVEMMKAQVVVEDEKNGK
jgi:hypothetical protein